MAGKRENRPPTNVDVEQQIANLWAAGETQQGIASKTGVSQQTVGRTIKKNLIQNRENESPTHVCPKNAKTGHPPNRASSHDFQVRNCYAVAPGGEMFPTCYPAPGSVASLDNSTASAMSAPDTLPWYISEAFAVEWPSRAIVSVREPTEAAIVPAKCRRS